MITKLVWYKLNTHRGCLKFRAPFAKGRVTLTQAETSMWHSGKSSRITSEIKQSWPRTPRGRRSPRPPNTAKQLLGSSASSHPICHSTFLRLLRGPPSPYLPPCRLSHTHTHTHPSRVSIPRAVTPSLLPLVSLTLSRAALHFSLPAGEHMLLVPLDSGVFRREGLFNVY